MLLRLGVQGNVGHAPGGHAPFVPLRLPLRKTEPMPAASPEWDPLRRRRMAMPALPPGGDSDFAF